MRSRRIFLESMRILIAMQQDYRVALAANVRMLMEDKGVTQSDIGRSTSVDQKTVGNVLRAKELDVHPGSETIAELAAYFGVPTWALYHENMTIDLLKNHRLPNLIDNFKACNEDGRKEILRVSENEVRYMSVAAGGAENNSPQA